MGNLGVALGSALGRGSEDSLVVLACAEDGSSSRGSQLVEAVGAATVDELGPRVGEVEETDSVEDALRLEVGVDVVLVEEVGEDKDSVVVVSDIGVEGSDFERD